MENANEIKEQSSAIIENVKNKSLNNINRVQLLDQCAKEAHILVDRAIENSSKVFSDQSEPPKGDWLTIELLSIENGKKRIEEYIQTWKRANNWLHHTEFLCEDVMRYSRRYRYKVQWSIPTRRKPVPRATASVYFTIEASTIKPINFLCNIYYTFEASKLVHRVGVSNFCEKWLKDIVESKILLMETINF